MSNERAKLVARAESLGIENARRMSIGQLRSELNHPSRFSSLLDRDTTALQNEPKPVIEDLRIIGPGSSLWRIELLQQLLRQGNGGVDVTGTWGPETETAVKRAQAELGWTETGVADGELLHELLAQAIEIVEVSGDDEQGE